MATTTTLPGVDRSLIGAIRDELERYPVKYAFGRGGKHCFVQIETQAGSRPKITFSASPGSVYRAIMNTRGVVRRTLKGLGVEPYGEERRATRTGTLGLFMEEAAAKGGEEPVTIETLPPKQIATAYIPPREDEGEDEEGDDLPIAHPQYPLCPDAIRESIAKPKPVASVTAPTQEKDQKPMLARADTTPANDTRQFVKLLQSETAMIARLVCVNAEINDDRKTCTYREGWSDERIHKILTAADPSRAALRLKTVADYRRQYFGATPEETALREAASKTGGGAPLLEARNRQRIDDLEAKLAAVISRLETVEDAVTRPGK